MKGRGKSMDESAFRRFLSRQGKKAHVTEGLIEQVRHFEAYLAQARQKELDAVLPSDLEAYAAAVEARQSGSSGKYMRGLALYYHFIGNTEISAPASKIREQKTAGKRRVFPLKEFRGVDLVYIEKLAAAGIVNVPKKSTTV